MHEEDGPQAGSEVAPLGNNDVEVRAFSSDED